MTKHEMGKLIYLNENREFMALAFRFLILQFVFHGLWSSMNFSPTYGYNGLLHVNLLDLLRIMDVGLAIAFSH